MKQFFSWIAEHFLEICILAYVTIILFVILSHVDYHIGSVTPIRSKQVIKPKIEILIDGNKVDTTYIYEKVKWKEYFLKY